MNTKKTTETTITRRGLLMGAGTCAIGAAGISALLSAVPGLAPNAEARRAAPEKWPWPYVKLDPEKTAEIAYREWYRVFCGAAVISSVFSQLREKAGEPYKSFPIDAFIFLEGGMSGWGTICGSNAGANLVTNLIIGPRTAGTEDGMMMGSEIMLWYSNASMPVYSPKQPKVKGKIVKTTSNSPLCHLSVGKWMKASGYPLSSPERKERCARVTASVAYHTVELLNQWKDGKYETQGIFPPASFNITAQSNCSECHGTAVPSPPSQKK